MSDKRPHWESDMFNTKQPNPKACEPCMFRPSEFRGDKLDRSDTANCMMFEEPEDELRDVYWDGADCEHYEKAV